MEERKVVELIVRKNRQMFPKGRFHNEDGEFAIISFDVIEEIEGKIHKDKIYNTIIAKGNMPEIKLGKDYHMFALETYDERYGNYSYEISYIGDRISVLDNLEDIKLVLEESTSLKLANEIIKLPNIKDILENRDVEALKQVNGIGEKRCIQIMDNYHEKKKFGIYLIKLSRLGLSSNMIKELVEKFSNYETIYNKIQENPYMLADDVKGIGFIKADELAGAFGIAQNSLFRIEAYTTHILKEKSFEGKSFVMTRDLIATIRSNTKDEYPITKELIGEVFESMRQRNKLWWNGNKSVLALPFIKDIEKSIAENLFRLINAERCDDLTNWKATVRTIEKRRGFEYTDEQLLGIETTLKNNVVVITGLAGTGKSSTLEPMTQILVEQQEKEILQLALAGKASQRIQEVTGYEAMTIHRGLEFNPKSGGFLRNEKNPIEKDIIVLDEASMVDAELFNNLLKAIATGTKLVILGDYGQLSPIGFGQVFLDLIESGLVPVVKLTKIHRQASKSAIITESVKIRKNNHIVSLGEDRVETLGELKDLKLNITTEKDTLEDKVIAHFKEGMEIEKDVMEVQVVVATRTRGALSAYNLNKKIKDIINPIKSNNSNYIEVSLDKSHKYKITEGDKVIITKNNYKVQKWDSESESFIIGEVFNGNIGIVDKIGIGYVIIDMGESDKVRIESKDYGIIELGYCITCHKGQGSGWSRVIVAVDSGSYMMLSCEWLYTAITRSIKHCTVVGETKAIRRCCSITQGSDKNTFLPTMLKEVFDVE